MRKVFLLLLVLVTSIPGEGQSKEDARQQIADQFKEFSRVLPDLDSAQVFVNNAIRLCKSIPDSSLLSQALDYAGYIQNERSNYQEALELYKKALLMAQNYRNEERESIILNHIHIAFRNLTEIDSSLYYAHKSLEKRIQLRDTSRIVSAYSNLAALYQVLDNLDESIAYRTKVYELFKITNDSINIVNSFMALAYNYTKVGDFDRCDELIQEVANYCLGGCSERDNSIINYFQGVIKLKEGNLDDAMSLLILAEDQSRNHYKNIHADAVKHQALIALKKADSASFVSLINRSLALALEFKQVEIQAFAYKHLFEYYHSKNDYKKALEYKLAEEMILDSIKSAKTMWNVNKIHSDMIRKKSEEVIQQKEATIAEKEKTNMLLQLSGGLALVIILGTVLSYQVIRRKNKTIRNQNQELSLYNFELQHDIDDQLIELSTTRKSVDTVVSRISHDVRGKVATLKLLSSLTKSDNPSVQDYLSKITLTAKEADDVISGLTNLSRIRSRELQLSEVSLPQRFLELFEGDQRESVTLYSDHVLLVLLLDQLTKLMDVYKAKITLSFEMGTLIMKTSGFRLSEDSEWETYLLSKEDFMPHVEFELMQIRVAVSRLSGKMKLLPRPDGHTLEISIPPLSPPKRPATDPSS